MRKKTRFFVIAGISAALAFSAMAGAEPVGRKEVAAVVDPGITVTYNGEAQLMKDANGAEVYPMSYNGTTYLPVRAISGMLGVDVAWDGGTQTVELATKLPDSSSVEDEAKDSTGKWSRSNPAPIGTSQTASMDGYISGNHTATVKIRQVLRGDEAWERIKAANMFNSAAPDGMEYLLADVELAIRSVDGDGYINVGGSSFSVFSGNNESYSRPSVVAPMPEFYGNLYDGGKLDGWVVAVVKTGDAKPKMAYALEYDGAGGAWFALY